MKTDWRWITALIVCIGLVIGAALWVTRTPDEPAPAPVAEVPAPLPPATGVDGEGLAAAPHESLPDGLPADPEQLPADVQAQPDAGSPAVVVPGEGTGGEVFVKSPAFRGAQRLNAGFRYPSGTLHGAWDIGINRGTKVFAAKDGVIVGRNDGVRNHPSGAGYAVSGSPSNWVLLCSTVNGKPAVLYYQHLSPGLSSQAKRGAKVKKGQLLGRSGNTGNSTGDHLHLSASYSPWACSKITPSRAEYLRYDYLRTPSKRLFAPSRFWATPKPAKPKPVVDASVLATVCRRNARYDGVVPVRRALGIKGGTKCDPYFRRNYAKWQRSLDYKGRAADGIPGYASLSALAKKAGNFRAVR